jgi:glycosyltransferase involved in cell wall biosynthesis
MSLLRDEDIGWLFVGAGPRREELRERAHASGATRVTFRDYLPAEDLAAGLAAADAHLITLEPRLAGLIAPSKLYGILAAGRPLLWVGPDQGRTPELIRAHAIGAAVRNGDARGLADAIRRLRSSSEARIEMGRRARALHDDRFSRPAALTRHVTMLEDLCSQ